MFKRKLQRIKRRGERYKKEKEIRDAYSEYLPDRKKRKVSNIMLVVSVVCIVIYTIACLFIQYCTSIEVSPTLTTAWYSFFGGELFLLAGIKTSKIIKGYDE